ncbi:MAG: diguanylate cyclase [Anaerolineae bacterium]|nr:diguanylate cyclase [Anaerolineae bacterium]
MTSYNASNQSELTIMLEKMREELNASEARFRNIVSRQPEGVVILDAIGTVYFANPAALRLMSQPPDLFFRNFNWRLGVGKTQSYESKISGKNIIYEIEVVETEWDLKKAFLILLRDITVQKEKEATLQQAIDEAEARTAELEIMRFVAEQLNQAAMLEETIQSGLEMIQALSGAKKVWALLVDEDHTPHLVLVDSQMQGKATRQSLLEMPENCSCLKKLISGELTGITRIEHCEWTKSIFNDESINDEHYTFPLITNAKIIGVLNLAVDAEKVYSQNDLNLLETISRELAAAIERGQALSETSDALSRDENINNMTRNLSGTLDLSTILQNVVRLSSDLIGADIGLLGLLSSDGASLTFPFSFGLPAETEMPPLNQVNSLIWDVIQKQEACLDTSFEGKLPELPANLAAKVTAVMAVPILGNDRCLGILCLYKTSRERQFSRFDQSMLESLGRQAGLAIINAELYFKVQQLTTSDTLTGINNRLTFINLAVKEVERSWRYGRPLALILVDIDHFSDYNEEHGYEAGNQALHSMAQACASGLRRVDIVGRLQNDQVALLLPETDLKNASDVAERLRLKINTLPIPANDDTAAITVSMGVTAVQGRQEIDLQTLLDRAETALFEAKRTGRNRVAVTNPEELDGI